MVPRFDPESLTLDLSVADLLKSPFLRSRGLPLSPSMAYSQAVWFVETSVFYGGLRKLRWALRGKGKRGGLRIIYYWDPAEDV